MALSVRKSFFLVAVLLIVLSMGLAFRWDMEHRIEGLEGLMIDHAGAISDIVAEANWHGLQIYQQWENEIARRLVNNAQWIAREDSIARLDQPALFRLAPSLGLHQIWILDADAQMITSNWEDHGRECLAGLPEEFLTSLSGGEVKQAKLGFHRRSGFGCWCYVVGAARPGGGAVLVDALADSLILLRREIGPGHLIKSIGQGRSVRYVAFQDETGVQASSTDRIEFLPTGQDPYLQPLLQGREWVAKESDTPLGRIYEVARVVPLFGGDALLRVGLDAAPLTELRADIRRRTAMRAVVLGVSVLLLSALMMAWQRQGALDRQVERISRELKRKEEEARRAEKLVAMGSLAAGVAHQIRNPLNSIHMIAQVLGRREGLGPEVREQARHIRDESARIETIVQEFLDFARPREPVFETADLAGLVREVVAVQESAHGDRDVILSVYAPGLEAEVDRAFMTEILENLVRNAAEAVGAGGKILVSLIGAGDRAEIVVADDGPGIAPAIRDRIFDLYFTTRPEGNGLGLSLAVQMAGAMGGSLALSDEPGLDGKGARFVLTIPLNRHRRGMEKREA